MCVCEWVCGVCVCECEWVWCVYVNGWVSVTGCGCACVYKWVWVCDGTTVYCMNQVRHCVCSTSAISELPPAPTSLTVVSAVGQRNVTLRWAQPTSVSTNQIVEYFVIKYRLLDNTEEQVAAVIPSNLSRFEVTNLFPGTTHVVWVVSRNVAGDSPGSNTVNVTTMPSGECRVLPSLLVDQCFSSSITYCSCIITYHITVLWSSVERATTLELRPASLLSPACLPH